MPWAPKPIEQQEQQSYAMISIGTAVAALVGTPTLFISYQIYRCLTDSNKRREATQGALGVKSSSGKPNHRGQKLEHAVGNLEKCKTVDDWIKSLPSRSAKNTLKRTNRVQELHGIDVVCVGTTSELLGWEHWWVCVDHEARATALWWISGFLLGSLRFLAANITEGSMDEFRRRHDGKLVAWSCMIAKGKTMRNMWFYQRSEAAKCLIWFYTVRLAVERCLHLGLTHLDLGPSHKTEVKELKAKYGFQSTLNWNHETASDSSDPQFCCDYSGPFVDMSRFHCGDRTAKTVQ